MTQPPYGPPPSEPPNWTPQAHPPPPYPPPLAPYGSPSRKRRVLPVVLAVAVAVLLIAIAVLVPVLLTRGDEDGPAAEGTSDLSAVQEFEDLTTRHLAPGETKDYPQSPSVGGDHAPVWLECGVYDEPVPEVNVVHDLEHGTTWITYRADLVDDDGVDDLAKQLPPDGIMSPYPDQEAPVVITVWGRQLELVGPDDPRIGLFITKYSAGDTAPEPFASCNGGVDPDELAGSGGTAA